MIGKTVRIPAPEISEEDEGVLRLNFFERSLLRGFFSFEGKTMDLDQTIYLDHASATPVRREVLDKMLPILCHFTGDSAGVHAHARRTGVLIEEARRAVQDCLGAEEGRVYFSESGSRAAEEAILGLARVRGGGHIVTSVDEDSGVLAACQSLEGQGFRVTYLEPDSRGDLSLEVVAGALSEDSVLLTLSGVNRYTGCRRPIEQLSALCRSRGVAFHLEWSLGCLWDIDLALVDLLTLSSHLIGGPQGLGVLCVGEGVEIVPSGLESDNLANIVGFAQALCFWTDERSDRIAYLQGLRTELLRLLKVQLPWLYLPTGEFHPAVLSLEVPGVSARDLVYQLDRWGVCALDTPYGIRFSLGTTTTSQELGRAVVALAGAIRCCRQLAGEVAA